MREFLQILLAREGHEVRLAADVAGALRSLEEREADLVFTDLKLQGGSGMEILRHLRDNSAGTQVIMMTAYATAENAVEAMRLGAYDYQLKPFKVSEVRAITAKALEKAALLRDNAILRAQLREQRARGRIIGRSAAMLEVMALIDKVGPTKSSVLIEGESGTGKELVARALHEASPRCDAPFVAVNCGAIAESLIEAELFGHVAGAFTGAVRTRQGLFEAASGGTLLLDEINALPAAMQVKLLRVLQERHVRRVGDDVERPVDVRIIAAANESLGELVQRGRFREDLFYRLHVVRIVVPPLRERVEDIPQLARALIIERAEELGKPIPQIEPDAMRALQSYDFPGNVRELGNFIERAVTLAGGTSLHLEDFPAAIRGAEAKLPPTPKLPEAGLDLPRVLDDLERGLIVEALQRTAGVRTRAASLLGLSFRSLRYRMRKLGLLDGEP